MENVNIKIYKKEAFLQQTIRMMQSNVGNEYITTVAKAAHRWDLKLTRDTLYLTINSVSKL